jgi:hypothetical protein
MFKIIFRYSCSISNFTKSVSYSYVCLQLSGKGEYSSWNIDFRPWELAKITLCLLKMFSQKALISVEMNLEIVYILLKVIYFDCEEKYTT